MAIGFKRTKRGGVTYTDYQGNKGTTQSRSYKDGATRRTYTNYSSGKVRLTETTTQGGYTVRKSRDLTKGLFNKPKKQKTPKLSKPPKHKSISNKAWKSKHVPKWNISHRKIRTRAIRKSSSQISLSWVLLLIFFASSPLLIDLVKVLFN